MFNKRLSMTNPEKEPWDSSGREDCVVCGFLCGGELGDICAVCFWENEGYTPDINTPSGGPNYKLSVKQARENFEKYGASDKQYLTRLLVTLPKKEWWHEGLPTPEDIYHRRQKARSA